MSGYIIQKKDINAWLDTLSGSSKVFLPQYNPDSDLVTLEARKTGMVPDWDHLTTTASPKEMFFPQTETLLSFERGENGLSLTETLPSDGKRVLFGIRTCDARALTVLDKLFDGSEQDPYYLNRRKNTALIAVACKEPREGCFCELLGIKETPWDLLLVDLGESFLAEPITETGKQLVAAGGKLFSSASSDDEKKAQKQQDDFRAKFEGSIDLKAIASATSTLWDNPMWIELSRRCIGCGACSYLCPTCHCFDIMDTSAAGSGKRYRCWDTCQERDFTLMGHGHNPRPTRKERHRQRVMHKFQYYPTRFGVTACVGCGRCVEKCPVNIDIREVLKVVAGI